MTPFSGFPAGKTRFTPVPDLFYTELLPAIGDLAELKLSLYLFWFLHRQRGYPRYMTMAELESDGTLLSSFRTAGGEHADPVAVLHQAAEDALARGTLLQLVVGDPAGGATYIFLNTPQGRKAVEEVKRGDLVLESRGPVREAHVERPRPNIYTLYEQNIGLLQPLLAQELEKAELAYPADWIEDAFQIAVENNARNWRYIKSILQRWGREGKDDGERPHPRRRR